MQELSYDLCDCVLWQLQLKFPGHLSDDPYHLDDIYEAAQFILHSTVTSVSTCQRFLSWVTLRQLQEDEEDCKDVKGGILKLNPSQWAPNMICLQCLYGQKPTQAPQQQDQ